VNRLLCGTLSALLLAWPVSPALAASFEIGVVLMHGKWGVA
jgi:hypothetical protein